LTASAISLAASYEPQLAHWQTYRGRQIGRTGMIEIDEARVANIFIFSSPPAPVAARRTIEGDFFEHVIHRCLGSKFRGEPREPIGAAPLATVAGDTHDDPRVRGKPIHRALLTLWNGENKMRTERTTKDNPLCRKPHQAFAAQYWVTDAKWNYLSATTTVPMGWAISAAVGAKLARPNSPCAVLTGDACMLMHGIEIQSAARYNMPIVYVVINNSAHGDVYLRFKANEWPNLNLTELRTHDWVKFAKALGAHDGIVVTEPADLRNAFMLAFAMAAKYNSPYVVDVRCDPNAVTPTYPWHNAK
jgi:hypothetical protein